MDAASLQIPLVEHTNECSTSRCVYFVRTFGLESKKLWRITGPAIMNRVAMYGVPVITQAFVGQIGDLELAAISMIINVIWGFNFGLLLGLGSALQTLCGQAFGAQQYTMLGIYLQRSWIVVTSFAVIVLPVYIFASPILKLLGQADDIAELTGKVAIWCIPMHFSLVLWWTTTWYLQAQLKNMVIAYTASVALILHVLMSWVFTVKLGWGLAGAVASMNFAWCWPSVTLFFYIICGGCPLTWKGFSLDAFSQLWSYLKLSVSSGIMLSVRVSNELGAGNGKAAKFSAVVSATTSLVIGIVIFVLLIIFRNSFASLFTQSATIQQAVSKLALLLAFTILLNSVQPVLSGVAIGTGKQYIIAYVNVISYFVIGVPLGAILGYLFHLDVMGIWTGMLCGTAVQTAAIMFIVFRSDWKREAIIATSRVKTWSSSHRRREEQP
ncbi:protein DETOXIFICATION 27 isoform X3 [Cryptomeria japonica]|uniref:protein DETOXIFICATION 27 isoform X3 n=1 Tax=Cryptomeria japonica TaxID=3369 RepID=UPI0025AB8FE1|nr:protein DETOXIFICATION 27 isoform X3 [Cryptomeria japonica]